MNKEMYTMLKKSDEFHWYLRSKREMVMELLKTDTDQSDVIKLADFGCGGGLMLTELESLGEVTGFDYNDDVLEFCREKHRNSNFEKINLEIDSLSEYNFDKGVALDIIEHIEDDLTSSKNINSALKKDGICVFTVPALNLLWSQMDNNLMHKRRYTKKELINVLKQANFEIEYISYYNFWFFPLILAIRILMKIFKFNSNSKLETNFKDDFINKICYFVLSSEMFFIKRRISLPIGVSLICLARKK